MDYNYDDNAKEFNEIFARWARRGDLQQVKECLDRGADINYTHLDGQTALHYAASKGQKEIVSELLVRGADQKTEDNAGCTPLLLAVMYSRENIASELLISGSDPSVPDKNGQTALHWAAISGCSYIVSDLLNRKLDPNVKDKYGCSALQLAVMHSRKNIASELLNKGSDPSIVDTEGRTLLHYAAIEGSDDLVSELINTGLDPNKPDYIGKTPLHYSAMYGYQQTVSLLINRGADQHHADNNGLIPLHCAVINKNEGMVLALLKRGSDPKRVDKNGKTMFDSATPNIKMRLQEYLNVSKVALMQELRGLGMENVTDLQELLHENFQKCFWNRVYLVGPYSVGKSCLAKILVGEPVPLTRRSTDGIWIYIGKAGMNIDRMKWIFFPKGNAITEILTNMLMSIQTCKTQSSVDDSFDGVPLVQNVATTKPKLSTILENEEEPTETNDDKMYTDERINPETDIDQNESKLEIDDIVDTNIVLADGKESVAILQREDLNKVKASAEIDLTKFSNMMPEKENVKKCDTDKGTDMASSETLNHSDVKKVSVSEPLCNMDDHILPAGIVSSAKMMERKTAQADNLNDKMLSQTSILQSQLVSGEKAKAEEPEKYYILTSTDGLEFENMKEITSNMSHDKIHQLVVKAVQEGKYKQMVVPIDIWDFGGQKDYYMTHQLFITSRGIFVLMFNGSVDIHKHIPELNFLPGHFGKPTVAVYLLHWVNSILTYCKRTDNGFPRIIFVATHKDDKWFEWTRSARRKQLEDKLQQLFKSHAGLKHLEFKPLFFVNATNPKDPEIADLKMQLMQRAMEHPRWGEPMPTKWIPLELQLQQKSEEGVNIISREQLLILNSKNESSILYERQIETFLKVQHSLGKLLYFDVDDLRDFIIISPAYLVEVLRSIVTEKQFWPKGDKFLAILRNLQDSGMIKRDDIYYLWGQDNLKHILPHKEYMIHILVHLDVIIAPRTSLEEVCNPIKEFCRFLVPCMITKGNDTKFLEKFRRSSNSIILAYTFIDEVIPPALSYRFLSSFLVSWDIKNYRGRNREKRMLFSDLAVVNVDSLHDVAVQVKTNRVIVSLIHARSREDISPTLASSLQECLTAAIARISEFYSMLSDDKKTETVNSVIPFNIEIGVFCKSDICFFRHNKQDWICEKHKQSHSTEGATVWFSEKEPGDVCPESCKGLERFTREHCPLPYHIRRLAARLSPDECREMAIFLGFKVEEWKDLEYQFQHQPPNDLKFMALWSCTIKNRNFSFENLQNGLENIRLSAHLLCEVLKDVEIDVSDLRDDALKNIPSLKALDDLSNHIGNSTMQLAIELQLDLSSIQQIQHENKNKLIEQTRKVFLRWRQNKTREPTVLRLLKALYRIGKFGSTYSVLKSHI